MSQSAAQVDTTRRLVLEHLRQQVKQLPVVLTIQQLVLLEWFAVVENISALGALVVPTQYATVEVLALLGATGHLGWNGAEDTLHHGQVFQVVVCLEERVSSVQFKDDAANAPDVARLSPTQLENDFRSAVMPRRDNRAVVFVIKRRRTKVNQTDFRRFHAPKISLLQWIVGDIGVGIDKQDVLWLQVGVCQVIVMQKLDGAGQLPTDVTHLLHVVRLIAVVFLQQHKPVACRTADSR
jgi:hypothetical protein